MGRGLHAQLFESRDPKTGDLIRTGADDDALTVGDLVRQERFGGGSGDARAMDAEFANRIATDARFTNNLDYYDENAEKLARKKMKSEAMKRQFAINDFARTKKALDSYAPRRLPLPARHLTDACAPPLQLYHVLLGRGRPAQGACRGHWHADLPRAHGH